MELNRALDCMEDSFLVDFPFVTGDCLTIADLVIACELAQAIAAGHSIGQCRPVTSGWFDRVKAGLQPHFDDVSSVLNNGEKHIRGRVYQCESFDM
jgi:glutathione S-transferase